MQYRAKGIIYHPSKRKNGEAVTLHRDIEVHATPTVDDSRTVFEPRGRKTCLLFRCELPDGSRLIFKFSAKDIASACVQAEADKRGLLWIEGQGVFRPKVTISRTIKTGS